MKRTLLPLVLGTLTALSTPAVATAADNDFSLIRLQTEEFDPNEFSQPGAPCTAACGVVKPDVESFEKLVGDVGQVFAPRFMNPAETLGEAGFAVSLMTSWSFIPNNEQYWIDAIEDQNPEPALMTGHVQVRKGLPFSFEVAGNLTHLFNSEMFTMGADVKWSVNEGFYYMPDVAVRGTVNTLMGSADLNLITTGWDVSISKDFGISGVVSLAPYAGYQSLYIIGSSRLLNAYPQDPRPPQVGETAQSRFGPEFVFEQHVANVNRFFLGARLNVWILSFLAEGVLGENVNQLTVSLGADF